MAKIQLKKADKADKQKKRKPEKKRKEENIVWHLGGEFIVLLDDINDEFAEIGEAGKKAVFNVGAGIVNGFDKGADLVTWFLGKTIITLARRAHELRIGMQKHRKAIVKHATIIIIAGVAVIAIFSSVTDYEYFYNGRALGIVSEQRDVLEILDMVSEELSKEYGSNITIDPKNDITFKPVFAYGKDIDDADTVLKRFTYMGDIQAEAYAIYVDGQQMIAVENRKIAESVLQSIKDIYTKGKEDKFEYVGFKEKIDIKPINTTLANVASQSSALKKLKSGGQQENTYEVQQGDTLYGICEKLGVTYDELKEMNPNVSEEMTIHVGDTFVTQEEVPLLTVETIETAVFAETIDYKTIKKESSSHYVGETIVTTEGKKGKARITARLTKENGKTVSREDIDREVIKEPVDKVVVKGTKKVPPTHGTGTFSRPVSVSVYRGYGMRWGRMHYGLDYAAPIGTTIRAADGGTVSKVGWSGAYGLRIVIEHGNGFKTLYAHCSSVSVSAGQKVYKGQTIGAVGNTGRSTGPHCHFEVFKNGSNVNPASYL